MSSSDLRYKEQQHSPLFWWVTIPWGFFNAFKTYFFWILSLEIAASLVPVKPKMLQFPPIHSIPATCSSLFIFGSLNDCLFFLIVFLRLSVLHYLAFFFFTSLQNAFDPKSSRKHCCNDDGDGDVTIFWLISLLRKLLGCQSSQWKM